jgi:molecular chaperone DnaK
VDIHVLQGEREMAIDNKTIGRFILDGIPPAPRGIPQIEVAFDIDANGILNVSAKDLGTGKQQNVRVEASSGLTKAEIEKMINDAKAHEAEDRQKKEKVETRNIADAAAFQSDKQLKELSGKLSSDMKSKLEAATERVKTALKGENVAEVKSATEALNQLWQQASAEIYRQTASQQTGAQGASSSPDDNGHSGAGSTETVVDAEFEEVK